MRKFSRFMLVLAVVLAAYNAFDFIRARQPDDLLAAAGFAAMAWGFWRNPRGFRDDHGNDVADDPRAVRVAMIGAGLVGASLLLPLALALAR